jgi:predicted anti-sigma-YlaC factor YlaD
MSCERWREAVSAEIDGEALGIEPVLVAAHLASCAACREYQRFAMATRRAARVQPAPVMPSLAGRVAKAGEMSGGRWTIIRCVLAVVAAEIVVFSTLLLFGGDGGEATVHADRHLGAFTLAYGVALIVVVARPSRARAMLPVAGVLAGALTVTAAFDLASGEVPLLNEASHLPEVISVLLIWLLAAPTRRHGGSLRLGTSSSTTRRVGDDQQVG